jgi:hypothetical protein
MLAATARATGSALLVVLMFLGWGLIIGALVDYVAAEFLSLSAGSRPWQVWGTLIGILIAAYPSFYWSGNPLSPYADWLLRSAWMAVLIDSARRLLRRSYRHIYQAADIIFCIGGPMLFITALVGWWIIDEVTTPLLLLYLLVITIIGLLGIYNNMLRMLALGYFNGYWLVDDNRLSYPFEAPLVVYKNLRPFLPKDDFLPWVLVGLTSLLVAALSCSSLRLNFAFPHYQSLHRLYRVFEKTPERSMLANVLLLLIVLLSIPLACVLINGLVPVINIHCFFAAVAIWCMDAHWDERLQQEPALSGDFRYFLSGEWRK